MFLRLLNLFACRYSKFFRAASFKCRPAGLQCSESRRNFLADDFHFDVTENGHDHVVGHDVQALEIGEVGTGEFCDRGRCAEYVQPVRVPGINCFAKQLLAGTQDLVLLGFDFGKLHVAFARELVVRESRILNHIGQGIENEVEVVAHRVRSDAEAVIAGERIDGATDIFDVIGDLLGSASFGAFQQHSRHEFGNAIVTGSFSKHAAFAEDTKVDKRQFVVFPDEQAQAVRQIEFLNFNSAVSAGCHFWFDVRAGRVERGDG